MIALLHGFAGSGRSWTAVASHLDAAGPGRLGLLVPTLPGHAGGPALGDARDFDDFVEIVYGTLRALQRSSAVAPAGPRLVGYSLGARVALALALRHPEWVSELTLIGVHPGLRDADERRARMLADRRWSERLRAEGVRAFADTWEAQAVFSGQEARISPQAAAEQREIRMSHDPDTLARVMELVSLGSMPDLSARLGELRMPVRLCVGELDAKFLAVAHAMLPKLRDARMLTAPGCGHNVALEAPAWLAATLQTPSA